MNFYYNFSNGDKWIQLSGTGSNPSRCKNTTWLQSESNTDLDIIKDVISDLHPGYGDVMNYVDHPNNLYVQALKFGHLCKYGYVHDSNNFIPFERSFNINIKKGERIIQVKGTSKVKAHKRRIKISKDLDRLGDKKKDTKEIVSTNYNESVKNTNDYISNLNETDEGKKILGDINNYTMHNYITINEFMKYGESEKFKRDVLVDTKEIIDQISNIKKFISDAPKFEGKVYRGLQYATNNPESKQRWDSFIKNIEGSKEIKFGSFTSTSSEKGVGVNFATTQHYGSNMKSVLITIQCKSGVSIENISQVQSEHEVLLDNDKTYKIISFEKQDERNYFLALEEIND